MSTKKISAIVLLLLGTAIFVAGASQYRKSRVPNPCLVSFTKSLGGKASMAFEDSLQRVEDYGIAGIALGSVLVFAGGVLLFKSGK